MYKLHRFRQHPVTQESECGDKASNVSGQRLGAEVHGSTWQRRCESGFHEVQCGASLHKRVFERISHAQKPESCASCRVISEVEGYPLHHKRFYKTLCLLYVPGLGMKWGGTPRKHAVECEAYQSIECFLEHC
jgi:hypothetical protein